MKTAYSTTFLAAIVAAAALVQAAPQQSTDASAASGQTAGPVSITQPIEGSTWKIGSSETITWQSVQDGVDKLIVNLMKGDPNALQLVQQLATEIDASAGTANIDVPKNATEGSDYSLAVGKSPSEMAYIGGLTISKEGGESDSTDASTDASTTDTPTEAAGNTADAGGETPAPSDSPAPVKRHGDESDPSSDGGVVSSASSAVAGVPTAVASGGSKATSAIAGAPSAAASAGSAATSAIAGAPSAAASAGSAATSAIAGAPSAVASGVAGGSEKSSDTDSASGSPASESSSGSSDSAASSASRNLISGVAMAIPAAVLAMTGF